MENLELLETLDLGENMQILWKDRTRILGIPIGLTSYKLSSDRLFIESGVMNIEEEQVLLYRVQDLHLRIALWQRPFHIGTVCVYSTDKSAPVTYLRNIKYPRKVKELIHRQVEDARLRRKMKLMNIISLEQHGGGEPADMEDVEEHLHHQDTRHPVSADDIWEELEELDGRPAL